MARERTLSEQAFEQFPQALILVDRETTVLSLNAVGERLTGWALRDAIGRPALTLEDFVLYRENPAVPGRANCSQRMVQTVTNVPIS